MRCLGHEQIKSLPDLPVITLDDDPEVFSIYLHTLYYGAEPLKECVAAMIEENTPQQQKPSESDSGDEGAKKDSDGAVPDTTETQATETQTPSEDGNGILKEELVEKFLIDLHLLAVKLCDRTAAELAIDELVELYKQERSVRKEMVTFVYQSAPVHSALRALYRDVHVSRVKEHWLFSSVEETGYPFDFVRDVLRRIWNVKPNRAGRAVDVPYQMELDATGFHCRWHPIGR
jgi:hypothetical protein